jgi:cellulose synthase operon protein B
MKFINPLKKGKLCKNLEVRMNKVVRFFFHALALAALLSSLMVTVGSAAPSSQTLAGNEAVVRFDTLGQTDTLLRGPYGTQYVRFGLPANWAFNKDVTLQLIVTANVATNANQSVAEGQFTGATLTVTMDTQSIATIPLQAGSNVTYNVPIPGSAMESPLRDGRHELKLFLDAGDDCKDANRQTSVVISGASFFTLPYSETEPATDLTTLPRPIFQRDSIFPINSVLVVPDRPTAGELQAAITTAASFGRLTGGAMPVSLVTMSGLTPQMRTESQLIFIGKSSNLTLLQGATLPSPLQGKVFAAPGMQPDDGILQMAISPWNTGRAVLVVGGNSDAGVIKAAQALSSSNIQTVGDHNLALVADVSSTASNGQSNLTLPREMNTFADLGYGIQTMNGVGRSETSVRFTVPPGFVSTEDAYLDLTFNHSSLLDFSRSGLTVFMNGNLIGSILLSEQTASTNTQRIKIPASTLTANTNELRFQVDLSPLSQCSFLDTSNLWFSILPESVINLPLTPATANTAAPKDMSSYPYPFTGEPTLSRLGMVLPANDPVSWNAASMIAFGLGSEASGALFSPIVAFDGQVPEAIQKNNNIIIVGMPTEMKILNDINQSLPAPFEQGTNVAVLKGQQVAYRFPIDSSLGFLQLIPSPWNPNNVVLAVTGTTPAGLGQAGNALTNPILRSRLKGNFALVNDQTLSVADTRTGLGMAGVSADGNASAEIPVTSNEAPTAAPNSILGTNNMGWIPLMIGGLLIGIVIVIIVAALTRRRVVVHQ